MRNDGLRRVEEADARTWHSMVDSSVKHELNVYRVVQVDHSPE